MFQRKKNFVRELVLHVKTSKELQQQKQSKQQQTELCRRRVLMRLWLSGILRRSKNHYSQFVTRPFCDKIWTFVLTLGVSLFEEGKKAMQYLEKERLVDMYDNFCIGDDVVFCIFMEQKKAVAYN